MNERMDIDDDQEIADGRLLPPAALCTLSTHSQKVFL
jgi:hypothetical protein